jgi:hypothetical protein
MDAKHRATSPSDPAAPTRAADADVDPRIDQKVRSTAKHAFAVTSLLQRHPTMRGVSGLADQVDESVRWAV